MAKQVRKAVRTYLIRYGKVVVIRYRGKFEGYFDIPGGKIEDGESSEEASAREFAEETGIRIVRQHFVGRHVVEFPERVFDFGVFVVDEYEGEPQGFAENDSMWADSATIQQRKKIFESIKAIPYLRDGMDLKMICDASRKILKLEGD
jgi:mutator protein MutT